MCCGHREYALPAGRKPDPTFDMPAFRAAVGAIMGGTAPAPVLIPAVDSSNRPTLRRGARGDLVKEIQTRAGIAADGIFGADTEAAVRRFQRDRGMVPDGIVGPKTWAVLMGG
jgi:peptidoglycan hydrolase-like protein with peptidoglycan-binding domain